MSNTRKKWSTDGNFNSGYEMEMFTLNKEGYVVHDADYIIKSAKKEFPLIHVTKEAGKHMLEIGVNPSNNLRKSFTDINYTLEKVWEIAERKKLLLYPFATYPGKFNPEIHSTFWYEIQKKLWGENKFMINGLCTGFHYHFSIESKTYNKARQSLTLKTNSKESNSLMSSYNFLIAIDPAVTTFMQSSPFVQGEYLAKDSRMLIYRGGDNLKYDGLWGDFQLFGGLQSYTNTITDLTKLIERRYNTFKNQLIKWGFDEKLIKKHARKLDIAWNPVKVNKHGTFEQRGMDMNLPSYTLGTSTLLQMAMTRIVKEKIKIIPHDIGIYKPFKLEKKELYVPPISVVREKLQYLSATEGIANNQIHRYCKAFLNFATKNIKKEDKKLVTRILEVLNTKETISDKIINKAKKYDYQEGLKDEQAAAIAEEWSYEFLDDIEYTKKLL